MYLSIQLIKAQSSKRNKALDGDGRGVTIEQSIGIYLVFTTMAVEGRNIQQRLHLGPRVEGVHSIS